MASTRKSLTVILEHYTVPHSQATHDPHAHARSTMDPSPHLSNAAGLAQTVRRVGSLLTLEAALAFVDGCSIDSDEEGDAVAPAPALNQAVDGTQRNRDAAVLPLPPPLSPRFFVLVDTIGDESDSEYVSMEDALKMLDTCEIEDEKEQSGKQTQQSSKVTKTQHNASFTALVQSVGSSDSDSSSSDASAGSAATTCSAVSTANSVPGARKPRQKAVTAKIRQQKPKEKDASVPTIREYLGKKPDDQADTSTTTTTTTEAAPKPKKKRVRKQRQELLYLREKVVEMQQVLESLQKGNDPSETASNSSTSSVSSPTSASGPEASSSSQQRQQDSSSSSTSRANSNTGSQNDSVVWELLAEKQLQERERAEQENQQLKAKLEGQIKLVRSLERLLIGQKDIEIPGSMSSHSKRPKMHFGDNLEDDSAIFRELKEELSNAYPRFEREFASSYLNDLMSDGGDLQVKKTVEQAMHVEFTASKVVQHSFEVTKKGLWRFMSRDGMKSQCYYYHELEESTGDYVARDFGCKLERQYRDVNVHGKQVLKRITQEHRDIFLWSAVVEPVKFSDAPTMKAVRFRERGWLVTHPIPPETGSKKATIVKTFVTFTPDLGENVSATNMAVGAITDLVLDSVEGNIHFCQDIVDRLVLEEEQRLSSQSSSSNLSIPA